MVEYSLLLLGIVSEKSNLIISKGFTRSLDADYSISIFCSYSEFDIPIGTDFDCLLDLQAKRKFPIKATLIDVTQGWSVPFDFIPKGHKTVSRFKLSMSDFNLIKSEIPIIDLWENSAVRFKLLGSVSGVQGSL